MQMRTEEIGRPFSVTSSDPKYNADYLDNIIRTKWLPILNEAEKNYDATHQISMFD